MRPEFIYNERVLGLWARVEEHSSSLYMHSVAVSNLAERFAAFLGLCEEEQATLSRAALLHDIGKLAIAPMLLHKASSLDQREILQLRTHAIKGYELLVRAGEIDFTVLSVARDHHERLDGTGYPRGIADREIDFPIRLVAICDTFAAMTELRPYAEPLSHAEALRRMLAKGDQFDLDLVSTFALMLLVGTPK